MILLSTVVLVTVTALVLVLLRQPFVVPAARTAPAATSAPVSSRQITDEHQVSVTVTPGSRVSVTTPVGGRVTGSACQAGQTVQSGTAPLSVDGVPRLALASPVAWWRDLPAGARGPDVTALHEELTRMGQDVTADGDRVGPLTIAAVAELTAAVGGRQDRTVVPLSEVVWLPAPSTVLSECGFATGDTVNPGELLGTAAPDLIGVRVDRSGSVAGDRVLIVEQVQVELAADGTVTDPMQLSDLSATASVRSALGPDGDGTLPGTVRLRDPVTVLVVPPSAVATEDGLTGCVLADGEPVLVALAGSQLGQTYLIADTAMRDVALTAPEPTACR